MLLNCGLLRLIFIFWLRLGKFMFWFNLLFWFWKVFVVMLRVLRLVNIILSWFCWMLLFLKVSWCFVSLLVWFVWFKIVLVGLLIFKFLWICWLWVVSWWCWLFKFWFVCKYRFKFCVWFSSCRVRINKISFWMLRCKL